MNYDSGDLRRRKATDFGQELALRVRSVLATAYNPWLASVGKGGLENIQLGDGALISQAAE